MGRPRLTAALKAARGTLRPVRERGRTRRSRTSTASPAEPRDYIGIAHQYIRDVLTGRVVAGSWLRKACERQERERRQAASDAASAYVGNNERAIDACTFVECCPHPAGAWSTDTLRLEPREAFIVSTLFGWRRKADGGRRFDTCYIEVARKNGKSALTSAVMLYTLCREGEIGGQVELAATTNAQARIVFAAMQTMVRRSAYLHSLGLTVWANAIEHADSGSYAHALALGARAGASDGLESVDTSPLVAEFCWRPDPWAATAAAHGDAGRLQVVADRFAPDAGASLDLPQRPSQASQRTDVVLLVVGQDVAHAGGGPQGPRQRQRLGRSVVVAAPTMWYT